MQHRDPTTLCNTEIQHIATLQHSTNQSYLNFSGKLYIYVRIAEEQVPLPHSRTHVATSKVYDMYIGHTTGTTRGFAELTINAGSELSLMRHILHSQTCEDGRGILRPGRKWRGRGRGRGRGREGGGVCHNWRMIHHWPIFQERLTQSRE
jgi:hypothetical protein